LKSDHFNQCQHFLCNSLNLWSTYAPSFTSSFNFLVQGSIISIFIAIVYVISSSKALYIAIAFFSSSRAFLIAFAQSSTLFASKLFKLLRFMILENQKIIWNQPFEALRIMGDCLQDTNSRNLYTSSMLTRDTKNCCQTISIGQLRLGPLNSSKQF